MTENSIPAKIQAFDSSYQTMFLVENDVQLEFINNELDVTNVLTEGASSSNNDFWIRNFSNYTSLYFRKDKLNNWIKNEDYYYLIIDGIKLKLLWARYPTSAFIEFRIKKENGDNIDEYSSEYINSLIR